MHTFNDTLGRTWTVTITVDAIRRIRSLLDINLLDAIEGNLLERLVMDPVLLCDILFALVQPEAQAKSITDEELRSVPSGAWKRGERHRQEHQTHPPGSPTRRAHLSVRD